MCSLNLLRGTEERRVSVSEVMLLPEHLLVDKGWGFSILPSSTWTLHSHLLPY